MKETLIALSGIMFFLVGMIRLSFAVTSDKDLAHPYYAVIAQIRDPGSKPGQVRISRREAIPRGRASRRRSVRGRH